MSPSETTRSTFCWSATRSTSVSASRFEWMSEMIATRMSPRRLSDSVSQEQCSSWGKSGRAGVRAEVCWKTSSPLKKRGRRVRIVVTGSLAYDYIMTFPGYFKDHLLKDRAHTLSVSFLVDSMKRMRGGVAGNIAYKLSLLRQRPLILGTVGHAFGRQPRMVQRARSDT